MPFTDQDRGIAQEQRGLGAPATLEIGDPQRGTGTPIDSKVSHGRAYEPGELERSAVEDGFAEIDYERGVAILGGFTVGKARLKPHHERFLTSFVAAEPSLREPVSGGAMIESIVGYTDAVGAQELNVKLRELRAASVADFLTQRLQVQPDSIVAVRGAPPTMFLGSNDDVAGRMTNRSVQMFFIASFVEVTSKLDAARELYAALEQKKARNVQRVAILTERAVPPKTPAEKEQEKSWWEWLLGLFFAYKGAGDPYDPTGGVLAEHLAYEAELEYYERNVDSWRDEIAYLEYENGLIMRTQAELSLAILNLRNGHIVQDDVLDARISQLLSMAYRDFALRPQ